MTYADDIRTVEDRDEDADATDDPARDVTVHQCSPDRTVFTEDGNCDGWIATDTTVELDR
jgi:hypothetical protein